MDLQTPEGGEAGLYAAAQYGGYPPAPRRGGRTEQGGTWTATEEQVGLSGPAAGTGFASSALWVKRSPARFPPLSDLPGGESQRGDEPRGDPAPSKPGRQKEEAHHTGLSSGLRPPHGEPFPAGLGHPGSSPRRPCSGLTRCVGTDPKMGYRLLHKYSQC